MSRDLTNTMICWTPAGGDTAGFTAGDFGLVPWPDYRLLSDRYEMTGGACYRSVHRADFANRKTWLATNLVTIYARDGIDPRKAHPHLRDLPPATRNANFFSPPRARS